MRDGCHEEARFLIHIPQIAPRNPVFWQNLLCTGRSRLLKIKRR